jgi:hypothetical protein
MPRGKFGRGRARIIRHPPCTSGAPTPNPVSPLSRYAKSASGPLTDESIHSILMFKTRQAFPLSPGRSGWLFGNPNSNSRSKGGHPCGIPAVHPVGSSCAPIPPHATRLAPSPGIFQISVCYTKSCLWEKSKSRISASRPTAEGQPGQCLTPIRARSPCPIISPKCK